jgi:prophage regulatory protein
MSYHSSRRIMRLPEVIAASGYKRTSIYNLMAIGKFPAARKLGPRAVGWDSQEVEAWVASKLEAHA